MAREEESVSRREARIPKLSRILFAPRGRYAGYVVMAQGERNGPAFDAGKDKGEGPTERQNWVSSAGC
jgi:hypothetical protein